MTIPEPLDECWPVDTSNCEGFENYDLDVQETAKAMAGMTLRMLTGYSVGGCPVVLRPCSVRCARGSNSWHWANGSFHPTLWAGTWTNGGCGTCGYDCGCSTTHEIVLPAHVGEVVLVKVDGDPLPATAYRVDNGYHLVRTDGGAWPVTQDMDAPDTEDGTFSVTYLPGAPVDGIGAAVAGVLACQYGKALTGGKCELPKGVTQITRQGITMTLTPGSFPGGLTGIQIVDAYITRMNPHALKAPSMVWSPDQPRHRVTTWRAP